MAKTPYNAQAFHNAYYAKNDDDLKYKYSREWYSFDIFLSEPGIVCARSYMTTIANIDNINKIALISNRQYSQTTGRQLRALQAAAPADYKVIITDELNNYPSAETIAKAAQRTRDAAIAYLQEHKYKSSQSRDYNIALNNVRALCGASDLYTAKKQERDEYESRLALRRQHLRETKEQRISEAGARKKAHFDALIAAGTPAIIARAKSNYIEPEYNTVCYDDNRRDCFIWDGTADKAIRTSQGVIFRPSDAQAFSDFENWQKGAAILNRYTYHGENPEHVFVVGCHRLPRTELENLRELLKNLK